MTGRQRDPRRFGRQGVGVLGLANGRDPYLIPLSFGFDGDSRLYFTYLYDDESRKRELSDRAKATQFLVYEASSPVDWQSVQLMGRLGEVPSDEWDHVGSAFEKAWHPTLFEEGPYTTDVTLYEFEIESRSGVVRKPQQRSNGDSLESPRITVLGYCGRLER
ncbi:pyridoxamine 5'-phosphate oxidase family protein [Natronolimnobius baerhuensis]|uniref:pyridoxamine 5'-phosphate oxidase family protein n=1 Tax=Natronolimnobius baerhuensis TaxID=253108 RepID=UPI0006CFEE4A|nr:pyridoxamine 5'-phosphate oxidase family protein [Natronolimnobius baerhuensis]